MIEVIAMTTPNLSDFGIENLLAEKLLIDKKLDRVQLRYAQQKKSINKNLSLWQIFIQFGIVSESVIVKIIAEILSVKYVKVDDLISPTSDVINLFNKEQCLSQGFIPLKNENGRLQILLGTANILQIKQLIFKRIGQDCDFLISDFSQVARFIKKTFHFSRQSAATLFNQEVELIVNDKEHHYSPEKALSYLLHYAVYERCTDIHLSPSASSIHVFFRVDGVMSPMCAMPVELHRLISFIKLTADMDISEQRRPQDGSFRAQVLDGQLTIRVSIVVTEYGERVVMRLLPEAHEIKGLKEMGYFPEDVIKVSRAMERPSGLILITGPTGSGKSSTLHAGLRMQHLLERNLLTVEDPLEYRVPGAGQTEVNRKAGYDFAEALRRFLRHDPDVILVGEMRDSETAASAIEASATGHLVLSTLHVTSVFGVIPRLLPMGLAADVIAENLLMVINQRLVRKNCVHCTEEHSFTDAECDWLHVERGSKGMCGKGCEQCKFTGYLGRLPVYEILEINDRLANCIADSRGREELRQLAHELGFSGIAETAKKRIILGQTTIEEVWRSIGEGPESSKD